MRVGLVSSGTFMGIVVSVCETSDFFRFATACQHCLNGWLLRVGLLEVRLTHSAVSPVAECRKGSSLFLHY